MKARLETADGCLIAERELPDGPIPRALVLDGSPRRVFVRDFNAWSDDARIYRQVSFWWMKARKVDVKSTNP